MVVPHMSLFVGDISSQCTKETKLISCYIAVYIRHLCASFLKVLLPIDTICISKSQTSTIMTANCTTYIRCKVRKTRDETKIALTDEYHK